MNESMAGCVSETVKNEKVCCVKKHRGKGVRWAVVSYSFQIHLCSRNVSLQRVGVSCVLFTVVSLAQCLHIVGTQVFVK